MSMAKPAVAVLWLLCIAAFFVAPASTVSSFGRGLFWLLAVVHAIECAVFFPVLRKAPGPLLRHLLRTFVFGILYVRDVRPLVSEGPAQTTES